MSAVSSRYVSRISPSMPADPFTPGQGPERMARQAQESATSRWPGDDGATTTWQDG